MEIFEIFVIASIFVLALLITLIAIATMKQKQCYVIGV